MKLTEKIVPAINKVVNTTKKHSPEILLIGGIVGMAAATVMGCVASTKLKDVNEKNKASIEHVREKYKDATAPEEIHDRKKEMTKAYLMSGVRYVRLYGPSVVLWGLSAGSVFGSNHVMKQRNAALAAAYATIDKGFKEYRGRVIEKFGEKVDNELKYGTKEVEVEKEVIGKDGKMKKVKEKKMCPNGEPSMYARYFDEYTTDEYGHSIRNWNWKADPEMNMFTLHCIQDMANARLKAKGVLFLNEVYEMLGFPATKAGQVVGWVNDPAFPPQDRHVDFGIFTDPSNYSDFVNYNDSILLDFNVAGNVWDLMKD